MLHMCRGPSNRCLSWPKAMRLMSQAMRLMSWPQAVLASSCLGLKLSSSQHAASSLPTAASSLPTAARPCQQRLVLARLHHQRNGFSATASFVSGHGINAPTASPLRSRHHGHPPPEERSEVMLSASRHHAAHGHGTTCRRACRVSPETSVACRRGVSTAHDASRLSP
jgi:hypothetical protein